MTISITSPTSTTSKIQQNGNDVLTVDSSNNVTVTNGLTVDTNTLHVDTTNNRVGIGTSSPDFKIEVVGGTNNGIHIKDAESATVYGGLFTSGTPSLYLVARSNHPLNFGTNDTERMRIDTSGRVTMPYQPAFLANFSTTGRLGTGTSGYQMVMDQTLLNIGSHYSTSTGRFTAPVNGTYYFSYVWQHSGATGSGAIVDLYKNGTGYGRFRAESNSIADYSTSGVSGIIYLSASDYITLYQNNEGAVHTHYTFFAGHLIG